MVRTRVGYAGGSKRSPTYHDLGDHTEAFEIDFDPRLISYRDLVRRYWSEFQPGRGWSRQYMCLLFVHDQEQKEIALDEFHVQLRGRELPGELRAAVHEAVVPHERFWIAEDYHQKYYVRHHRLARELAGFSEQRLVESTLAARLNGFAGGYGSAALLEAELPSYGLSPEGEQRLWSMVQGGRTK